MNDSTIRAALLIAIMTIGAPSTAQPGPPESQRAAPQPAAGPADAAVAVEDTLRSENEVDLYALLEQVAGNERVEFLVDPRVRARVVVVPPTEEPTLDVLRSVLRVHGYMAVEIGGRIHIVPDAIARQMPTRLLQEDDRRVSDDEIVTRVLALDVENAALLVPILRPLLPVYAHLAAMGNKLVIVDHYDNVRRITALARELAE